ncbi:MAG: xanthine dehydrogenase family protein molybdopterin-binding subunit [Burkholderiales bacterium]|nr:xanthine dehydrogenase family protein molybdopterin-binding subunit [Burkholderiales bacterium]
MPDALRIDLPNSYIGRSVPRPNARRLLQGRGQFTDDLKLPRMLHVAFLRSPHAHARIVGINLDAARKAPGVVAAVHGKDLAKYCTPWVGVLSHFPGLKSAPQYPLAIDKVVWQGEPVVAVVAESRALAEDALESIEIDYDALSPVADMETALAPDTPVIHPELGDNLAFAMQVNSGDVDATFARAAVIVEDVFHYNRHTCVSLEPRCVLADFDPSERKLTVYASTQTPYQMQDVYSRHLGIPEENVRVVARDVGGAFGMKLHVYGDDMATCALAIMLERPVKFTADRLESFVTDIHARDHRVKARMAVSADGEILGMEVDDLTGIGPFSVYPRTSAVEGAQVIRIMGGPYRFRDYRGRLQVVLQNKNLMSQYRAVGHPIACTVTEALVDKAAAATGLDPVEFRRRNYVSDDMYPYTSPTGYWFERLSHHQCLDRLLGIMRYDDLRAEQAALRERGVWRGIGLAAFIEITNPGPAFYGVGGARISSQDGCVLKLEPSGKVRCLISVNELGQGTETVIAQIVADTLGIAFEDVRVITGDTETTPHGGATWASRGAGIGGETAMLAARALRENVLSLAGVVMQAPPASLDIRDGQVVDAESGTVRLSMAEVARIGHFRPDTLPKDFQAELNVVRHYVPRGQPFAFTNGIQASYLEVDVETGFVKLLGHWVVEDCGRVLNPMLVAEQIRGGVVQGIGPALFEHCVYSEEGQMLSGTLADYLVPMAGEMPDIVVAHVETPTQLQELGVKGTGEAGTAGASAAVMNALNDALVPFSTRLTAMPFTPQRILEALGRVSSAP